MCPTRGRGGRYASTRNYSHLSDSTETSSDGSIRGLSVEELQTIRWLMTQLDPSVNCTTAASVHLGTLANALGIINWIIDSGAADHMTGSILFSRHILHAQVRIKLEWLTDLHHPYLERVCSFLIVCAPHNLSSFLLFYMSLICHIIYWLLVVSPKTLCGKPTFRPCVF